MTQDISPQAWIEDACQIFDKHAQDLGWKSHIYSEKLRALSARLAEVEERT